MFSVVIPLFNKGKHIGHTLESVLAQTEPPDQIIVVDDGSTDDGPSVVEGFADRGVQLVRQHNQGVSAARNCGVRHASNDYVAFLDADDWWLPDHLEWIRALIIENPESGLFSTAHLVFRNGGFHRPKSAFPDGWRGQVPDFFRAYAVGLSLINSSTAVVRRAALVAVDGFPIDVRRGEDVIAWVNVALRNSVAHLEISTVVYNQQATNRSDEKPIVEPPGSLLFIAALLASGDVSAEHKAGLVVLFDRITLLTAAGCVLTGNLAGALEIRRLAARARRVWIVVAISGVLLMPQRLLRLAQRWRHRSIKNTAS